MDSFEQERLFLPRLKRFEDFLEGEVIACLVWPEILGIVPLGLNMIPISCAVPLFEHVLSWETCYEGYGCGRDSEVAEEIPSVC